MAKALTIGAMARRTGLSVKTIRFYEGEGLLPAPRRSEAGYRLYAEADVQRLQLVRRAKMLGLGLPAIKTLVDQAFDADCARFGAELTEALSRQRSAVEARIAELRVLQIDLEAIERHVTHCREGCEPAALASECGFCGLITLAEGGES